VETNKELRNLQKTDNLNPEKEKTIVLPFKKFEFEGYEVFVGKSAKNNDELTLKFARKDDLWLHARGVSGSHVIIRKKGQNPIPVSVIRKAAQLAAYYSKGKSASLCPVIYTPKKYVRKPKGADPGAVVVEKEEVILAEPASFEAVKD
jgi:predicted ribosome quality control (RQC) complex YloA/Tae2 family protein